MSPHIRPASCPRVLLVESSKKALQGHAEALADGRWGLLAVEDAQFALAQAIHPESRIELVIAEDAADESLGQDGAWLARELRKLAAKIPIVLVSESPEETRRKCAESNLFVEIHPIPIRRSSLREIVERYLPGR